MRPMYELTRKDKSILFEQILAKQKVFETIKVKLIVTSVVVHFNFNKLFILYTNASGEGVEAILYQKGDDKRKQIITYTSRIFNEHEKKYLITE